MGKIDDEKIAEFVDKTDKTLKAYDLWVKKQNLEVEMKDLLLQQKEEELKKRDYEIQMKELLLEESQATINTLLKKIENEKIELYGKKDIMRIFDKESNFALNFLRFAKGQKLAMQIGKEYYIKKENLKKILDDYNGLKLEI